MQRGSFPINPDVGDPPTPPQPTLQIPRFHPTTHPMSNASSSGTKGACPKVQPGQNECRLASLSTKSHMLWWIFFLKFDSTLFNSIYIYFHHPPPCHFPTAAAARLQAFQPTGTPANVTTAHAAVPPIKKHPGRSINILGFSFL